VCVVADACRDLQVPVVAVLGNHDWQSDRPADLSRALAEAGVVVEAAGGTTATAVEVPRTPA